MTLGHVRRYNLFLWEVSRDCGLLISVFVYLTSFIGKILYFNFLRKYLSTDTPPTSTLKQKNNTKWATDIHSDKSLYYSGYVYSFFRGCNTACYAGQLSRMVTRSAYYSHTNNKATYREITLTVNVM